jgi:acyl phosphate:glycerol-3-phosphate acyltransferase
LKEIVLLLIAYLIGSIPTAVWLSKHFFDVDIREYGSGNAGATNIFRTLGKKWGIAVMLIDMLKGLIAIKLVWLMPFYADHDLLRMSLQIGLGLAAVLGHIFPIWADFKGGKGVATIFGLVLGITPWTAIYCGAIFVAVLYFTRFVSLSSILASMAFPIFILLIFNFDNHLYRVFAVAVALMVILTHQKNIARLIRGNENKVPILKYRDKRRERRRAA